MVQVEGRTESQHDQSRDKGQRAGMLGRSKCPGHHDADKAPDHDGGQ